MLTNEMMNRVRISLQTPCTVVATVMWFGQAVGGGVLAEMDWPASEVTDTGDGVVINLTISQPVPYRVFMRADPPRLIVDFAEVDFAGSRANALDSAERVMSVSAGPIADGWSRLVATLDGPYRVMSAEEKIYGTAEIRICLAPVSATVFAAVIASTVPQDDRFRFPSGAEPAIVKPRQTGEAPLVVALDPGHGGIDPGAQAGDFSEAAVTLGFAEELAAILRAQGMAAVLTRTGDYFVPLENRVSLARAAGADVFLSLHADTLVEGTATGATIYTLSDKASETASARLAERHDRDDLLAGVDLSGQDDMMASIMMDMLRTETAPRSDRLAQALKSAIMASGAKMHRHPVQQAGFSVLKAPEIPSVLLEIGFLSSKADRARLTDSDWRRNMQKAVANALIAWAAADAAEARLVRQ